MTHPGFAKLYKQSFPEVGDSLSETLPAAPMSVGKSNSYNGLKIFATLTITGIIVYMLYNQIQNKKNEKK